MRNKNYWKTDWIEVIFIIIFVSAILISGMGVMNALSDYSYKEDRKKAQEIAASYETEAETVKETEAVTETEPETEEETEEGTLMYITTGVNVRSGPGQDFERIDGLSEGDEVYVLSEEDGWNRVRYEGDKEGYVYSDYFSETKP